MKTKIMNIIQNRYLKYGTILLVGLLLGWLIFGGSSGEVDHSTHDHSKEGAEKEVWTCSMHPQIKMDKPGKCPICAMDLIPLKTSGGGDEAIERNAIQLSKEAVALANIQTSVVSRQNPIKEVRLYGTIQEDERLSQSQTSHVNGRIEKLFINFTGETIREGQTIATIYSPELLSAQQELLEAVKMQGYQPALLAAAKEKLRLWKLTDRQIAAIEKSGVVNPLVEIKATSSGIVTSKKVNQGDYIGQGSVLFSVANLSRVWAMFEAYETDLPFLKVGEKLEFTLQAMPGKSFSGTISFVDPLLDPTTRTSKVRVETANPGMQLKPGMYANAIVTAALKQFNNEIVIPKSAVLWTGKRSIVYVKQPNVESPAFLLREVDLGPSLGDSYVVTGGINDGDEIVTNGAFTIDASAQLEGKQSMMNNDGSSVASTGHNHGTAEHKEHKGEKSHEMFKVSGLCEMCKSRIEKAAKGVKGVINANWDMKAKVIHLDFDPKQTSKSKISKAIAGAGHDTELDKAPKSVYDALPSCCHYDR